MASERDHVSSSRWRIFVTHLQRNFIVAVGQNETIFNLKKEILKSYDVINSSYGERTSCFSGSSSSLSPSCIGLFLLNNYELCNHNIVADVLFDGASVITSHADPSSVGMVQNHPYQPNPSPACINQFPYPLSTSVPFNYQRPMLLSQTQKSLSQFNISTARGGDFFDDLSRRPTCTSELGTRGPVPRSEIEIREPRTEFNERDTAPEDIAIDKERIKEKEQDPPPHPPLHPSTHEEEEEEEDHTESERERALPAGATTVPPPPAPAPAPVKGKRKAEPSLTDNTKAKKKKRISKKKDKNTIPSTCTEDDEDTPTITGETSKVTKRSKKKQTTSSSKKTEAKTRKEDPVVPAVDMTKSDKNKSEKVSKKRQTTSTSKKTETKTRKEDSLSRSFVRELLSASSDEGVPVPIAQLVEDKTEKVGKEREEALEEQREQEKESDGNVVKETAPIIQTASPPHTRSKNKRESKTASKASTTAAATKKQPKKLALSKTLRKKTPTTAAAVHTPPLIVPADSTETKQDPPNKTKQVLTNKSKAKTVTIIDMLSESEEEEDEEDEEEDEGGEGGKSAGAPGQEKNKTPEVYTLASPSLSFSSSSDEDDEDITDKEGHPSIKTVAINTGNTVATGNTGGNTMDTGNTRDTGSNDSLSEEEEEKENVNETPKASQELFGISKEMEGREGSEEIPIQIPIHKVKTTIPPTTPKKSAASNEDNEESSSNVSSSEEEEEEEREARKGGAVPSALSALVIDANPPSKKTVKKTSVVIPFKSKFQHKLKSSPAAIMPNKLAQKRKQQQTRKIGGIEQVTADEERLSQSLSQDDLSQMIANNESVWAV